MTQAIKVLTSVSASQIIRNGATGNWSAAAHKVADYPFVVCVRHGNHPASPKDVPHKTAFLIGRILKAVETDELDGKGNPRLLIMFDEYAEIKVPDVWGDSQNPVGYFDLEKAGINVTDLEFIPVADEDRIAVVGIDKFEKGGEIVGISFEDARKGIALRYGVDPRAVEITIRG